MNNNTYKKQNKIDMTTGNIMGKVFLFAIPIVIANVLQMLYTTVDALVLAKYCGDSSLAAIGTSAQPVELLLCIFLGIGSGVSILMSQYAGANDLDSMKKVCNNAVFFVYVVGIPLGFIGYFLSPLMLTAMKAPKEAYNEAVVYTSILFLGTIANIGYNMNAGILRGMGDSKASLLFLFISCIMNIALDILFVGVIGMGMEGAAFSTIIAQYFSWLISIAYIRHKFEEIDFPVYNKEYDKKILKEITSIGLPIGLNHSLYSFGHIALQVLINAQGADFAAGITAAGRVNNVANVAITALSSAATTFAGQNYGAKRYDRLRRGHLRIPVASGLITIMFGLTVMQIRLPILSWFSKNDTILMYADRYVVIMLFSQWIYAIFNGIICIVNGVGLIRYTTIVNILMLWAVRIPSAIIINRFFDGTYVMLCYPISFGFGMIMMLGYYLFSKRWKQILNTEMPINS